MRSSRTPARRVRAVLVTALWLLAPGVPAQAPPEPLETLATGLRLDPDSVTLSGISSGAFMAQQMHVVHSAHVRGVGLIAGGPYRCAAGLYPRWYVWDWTGLYTATSVCSNTNPMWFYEGPPDPEFSVNQTREAARDGAADDPQGLRDDRVWLLSGSEDETVPRGVVEALEQYYLAFADAGAVHHERLDGAAHAMITDDAGNACDAEGTPYINDCDYDAAGELLRFLLEPGGTLAPPAAALPPGALRTFDQRAFFDAGDESVSLHASGWVYLPAACRAGEPCRLHVAFHGCRQHPDAIGDRFVREAGYNEWAETNRIVVLYPQTRALEGALPWSGDNPRACWDWWGYSGDDYARRSGSQIRAVSAMINALLGQALLRD